MATRNDRLLKKLGFKHIERLKSLSCGDALSLFAYHALGVDNFDSHPTLKPYGEGIVKKCGGLPLALKALGRLMRTKADVQDWEDVLNSEIWELENHNDIIPALRLSYNDLPACLKRLFAYCSLFPQDFVFDKNDLVLMWMAEGFLNQLAPNKERLESLGHEYFDILFSRLFFEVAPNDTSMYVMHDLVNVLAKFVAGDYFLRFDNRIKILNEDLLKYRHMSFIREEYVAYQKFEVFKSAQHLRTFVAVSAGVNHSWDCFYLSNKILVDLLSELPLLRVLCLSGFQISGVPVVIGSLKHLRYLNLSRTKIVALPENICNLVNLQTLIVFGCSHLTKLPNIKNLKNLRHLDITDTPLIKMPVGIGELENLQTLTKIIIEEDDGFAITKLKKLENLRGKISVKGLENVQKATHAQMANFSRLRLTELELEWSDGSQKETPEMKVLENLQPKSDDLKDLKIVSYNGIEIPNWVGHALFSQLTHVSIRGCRKCTYLPPLGNLRLLKKLFIQDMDAVKVVDLEFLGTTGVAFPSLEILSFEDMKGWEEWSTNSEVIGEAFPCLQELLMKNCCKLAQVSLETIPSLKVIKLKECSAVVLGSLVRIASKLAKLEIVDILQLTDEVWRVVIGYLREVEEVKIEGCNEIKYLWESVSEASKALMKLRKLVVWNCLNLVSMGEKEGGDYGRQLLTSLRNLEIWSCKSMESCSCPNSIETLSIDDCSSLTSVSFPTATGGRRKLKSLVIMKCEKLLENELGGDKINSISMPILKYIKIVNWPNLKSSLQLSHSLHLTHLMIENSSIESFLDLYLPNLTHLILFECPSLTLCLDLSKHTLLKHMRIRNCLSMGASFLKGNYPPKLWSLEIGGLNKTIFEWGELEFPSSLVELELYGENVRDFSQLSKLLPETLTIFEIKEFKQLESLSKGLEHLKLLQQLIIRKCPKVTDLPETLLPSLLRLRIIESPKLKDLCSIKLPYWRLISHIPCIDITDDSST